MTENRNAEILRKSRAGYPFMLSSGVTVRVRYVAPSQLLAGNGNVPDFLLPVIAKYISTGETPMENKGSKDPLATAKASVELMNLICRAAIISPRVVDEPAPDNFDEIGIGEIPDYDKGYLSGLLMLPASSLESFCEEHNRDVESILSGAKQSDTPVSIDEPVGAVTAPDPDTGE